MALSYAEFIFGELSPEVHWVAGFALVCGAVATNVAGVDLVGESSFLLTMLVCIPALVIVFLGSADLTAPAPIDTSNIHWLSFITCLMWNTSGFDDAGAMAAEVKGAKRVYPRALGIALVLIIGMYVATIVAGTAAEPDYTLWRDGFLVSVGRKLGGRPLEVFVSLGGFVSAAAQLNSLMCASVREVVCMAAQLRQPVPSFLARLHPTRGTPHVATYAFGMVLLLTLNASFVELIAATCFFDCISFLAQFASWLRFRWNCRYEEAPDDAYRAPVGFLGVLLLSFGPIALCSLVIVMTALKPGGTGLLGFVASAAVGEALFRIRDLCEQKGGRGVRNP
eukprot:TRINITY_DN199_c1_g3_i1.p1 TRINITY_DN199_c1_g3~~TRINITY_DN199_c1_g3_i1.p1  ORF type:complete len:365 (-),score=33.93 TRINITY_DN199_c1_g3_i1:88-1098(-)